VVSLFVVTVNNMLTFTPQEEKSYTLLLRLHYKEALKKYAVNVLSAAYQNRNVQHKEKDDQDKVINAVRRYRAACLIFQNAVAHVRSFYDGDTDTDILMRAVENLKEEVDTVKLDQEIVNENLSRVCSFIEKLDNKV
jgi:alpha-L-fucosidase